ncbi:polyhydroxyalkanoic acid system family protein [Oricola indica]|jgi:putative polyhydroxyalkanoate system protein|uniref:polyhydroxyalkanoic acid system family protein n=1 Tax=Oricola indica TaxID=2872591 RepID=UPI001CC10D61|nr:polyhydroxyalkanoic acid system family protein [Oricola indica]
MAKPVTVTISHELGREEAYRRIDEGFGKVADGLGFALKLDQHWEGDTLAFEARAMGQVINGTVDVAEDNVVITVVLPLFLAGLAERIKGNLEKESTLLLEKK